MSIKETAETEIILSGGQKAGNTINELTAQSVKLNREIKKMEIGSEEYVRATQDYKQINNRLKDVKKEVYGVDQAQKDLNQTMSKYVPFIGQVQQYIPMMKGLASATKGQTMAQRVLNTVTKAFPLAFVIGLLASLISYLTTTQEGMDKLRKVTLPVVQIFERMKGVLQDLGGSVFKGIAQMLKGDLKGGFETLWEGLKGAGTGIVDSFTEGAKAGRRLADLTVEIEQATNALELSKARLNRQIDEENEKSKNLALSEAERQQAAQNAIKLIEQRKQQELALLDLQIEKLDLEQQANDTDRQGEFEMQKLLAQREEIEATASRERRRLNNIANADAIKGEKSVTGTVKEEKDKQLKAQQDYAAMVERAERDLETLRISLIQDETERKILQYERDIEQFKGTEDQKAEYAKLKKQQLEQELAKIEEEATRKRQEKALKDLDQQAEMERAKIDELFYSKLISEEERNRMLYDMEVRAMQDRLALLVAAGETQSLEYQKIYTSLAKLHADHEAEKTKVTQENEEKRWELQMKGLEVASGIFGGFADLLAADEEARKKNWLLIKALKKAEILANVPVEISNIWKNANTFPVPWNTIVGVAQTGLAFARSVKATANLDKVQYAMGGPVFGPSHQAGGIPFSVKGSPVRHEMEGGEIILTKGVSQNPALMAAASMINQAAGGRAFAMGGPVNPMTRAAQSPQQVINNVVNNNTATQDRSGELINELREFRRDINGWQRDLRVNVPIQKLREVDQRLADIEADVRI